MLASVRCGRMLVWTSVESFGDTSCAVPSPRPEESLTSVAPSTRQNFSASSVSTRLHWGQRFIKRLIHQFIVSLNQSANESMNQFQFKLADSTGYEVIGLETSPEVI